MAGFVIALVGAPGAAKHALAKSLQAALTAQGSAVAVIPDLLELADLAGSPSGVGSLRQLAEAQARDIAQAASHADTVLTLSTPWQIAAQSLLRHGQALLVAPEAAAQWGDTVTLLLAPACTASAPDTQEPASHAAQALDALLRGALDAAGLPYGVLTGSAPQQLAAALAAIPRARSLADTQPRWQWVCERCGDGGCERHLLRTT